MKQTQLQEALQKLSPSETTPLLLSLAKAQCTRKTPADLLSQFERDGFVEPSPLDQRLLHTLDGLAFQAASEFEALQLSPTAPLGSCSVLAPTSQDRTISAARGLEVVSDPTNMLALECAKRLRRNPSTKNIKLCTAHQTLRAQALPPKKGFSRHFRLFALAEAGAATANDGFEVEAITRHVGVFDSLFDLLATIECEFPKRRATMFLSENRKVLGERLIQRFQEILPKIEIQTEVFDSKYYDGVRVLFGAENRSGEQTQIADTGLFDWVSKLTANKKLRFVASGIGIQLAPMLFTVTGSQ